MDAYMVVLRIVHIVSAIFWVGGVALFVLFIQPTAQRLGPQAGPFMTHLAEKKKVSVFLAGAGGLTVLAGVLLYWRDSGGLDPDWITSPMGLTFTIGAISAIIGLLTGVLYVRPKVDRMGELGRQMAASAGSPSGEVMAEVQSLQGKTRFGGRLVLTLLSISAVAMASARYIG